MMRHRAGLSHLNGIEVQWRRRFDEGDPYFTALSDEWGEGVRQVFGHLPELRW